MRISKLRICVRQLVHCIIFMLSVAVSKILSGGALSLMGRRHIVVSGIDTFKFLQGLTTNDVMKFAGGDTALMSSVFLNPKVFFVATIRLTFCWECFIVFRAVSLVIRFYIISKEAMIAALTTHK